MNYDRMNKEDYPPVSEDEIFVFGSNIKGIHGRGAALFARRYHGAKLGIGHGHQDSSYAIPTKATPYIPLGLEEVAEYVGIFVNYTLRHPELKFYVSAVGCGNAGFSNKEIAPLFKGAVNCRFPEEWEPYLT